MAKIVMWGLTTLMTEEQKNKLNEIKDKYDSLSLQFGTIKNQSVLTDCLVLLKHDADIPENTDLNTVQWTIISSGGITEPKINEANKTAGIPPTILIENLADFLSATKSKTLIEKQDIEILFAIDPKLEELLLPFATVNPSRVNNELIAAKNALNYYLKSKA